MNDQQEDKLGLALEIDGANYWVLKITTETGTKEVKKWWEVDFEYEKDNLGEGPPTIAELKAICSKPDYKDGVRFTLSVYSPNGGKRLRFVTFDPPKPIGLGSSSEVGVIFDATARIIDSLGARNNDVLKAGVAIMEENRKQTERFGLFSERVIENQLAYERERNANEIEDMKERHEEDKNKELTLMALQQDLESAKEEGSVPKQLIKTLLEEPEKLKELMVMGIDTLDKIGKVASLKSLTRTD